MRVLAGLHLAVLVAGAIQLADAAAFLCSPYPCDEVYQTPCFDMVRTHRLYGSCCSLQDVDENSCRLTVASGSCSIRDPGYTCIPEQGCVVEWNVISADTPGTECPASSYEVPVDKAAMEADVGHCPTSLDVVRTEMEKTAENFHTLLHITENVLTEKLNEIKSTQMNKLPDLGNPNLSMEDKWQKLDACYDELDTKSIEVYDRLNATFSGDEDVYYWIQNFLSSWYAFLDDCKIYDDSYYELVDGFDNLYGVADTKSDELYLHADEEIEKLYDALKLKSDELAAMDTATGPTPPPGSDCPSSYDEVRAALDQTAATARTMLEKAKENVIAKLREIRKMQNQKLRKLSKPNPPKSMEEKWQMLSDCYDWLEAESLQVYVMLNATFSGDTDVYHFIDGNVSPWYAKFETCLIYDDSFYVLVDGYYKLYEVADTKSDELYARADENIKSLFDALDDVDAALEAMDNAAP